MTIHVRGHSDWNLQDAQQELNELIRSCRCQIVSEMTSKVQRPNPTFLIGRGKIEEIAGKVKEEEIDVAIFNQQLSPAQQRNIEEVIGIKTIDRSQLILDIFAQRAQSREGKLQVELAQLQYLLPRLTGQGILLSRLGGGIGTRGPGEQKLEMDRRRIRDRIGRLERELKEVEARRAFSQQKRERREVPTVVLIGYTNAGKSTLMNQLTQAGVLAKDQMFSTLDPVARRLMLPNHQSVVLVDTVGFIHDLPHHLIEAFNATLEGVRRADILLHVLDVSHPRAREHYEAVYDVLEQIESSDKEMITLLNKIDLIGGPDQIFRFQKEFERGVPISAKTGEGVDLLLQLLAHQLSEQLVLFKALIPSSEMRLVSRVYEEGQVFNREDRPEGVWLEARVPIRLANQIKVFAIE